MSRIAIIGSCITRDLWPMLGETPENLLYVSRTSLATLFAPAPSGLALADEPPEGLRPQPYAALIADISKTALATLISHRPTHIIFDFIDERFDLISVGGGLIAHTWEMDVSGLLDQTPFLTAHRILRASSTCELLWGQGAREMAAFLSATPLRDSTIILHKAQWARGYRTAATGVQAFAPEVEILQGRSTRIDEQNARLREYQTTFARLMPHVIPVEVAEDLRLADADHRWGLSPFHYITDYYRDIWRQLREAGV